MNHSYKHQVVLQYCIANRATSPTWVDRCAAARALTRCNQQLRGYPKGFRGRSDYSKETFGVNCRPWQVILLMCIVGWGGGIDNSHSP